MGNGQDTYRTKFLPENWLNKMPTHGIELTKMHANSYGVTQCLLFSLKMTIFSTNNPNYFCLFLQCELALLLVRIDRKTLCLSLH